jgi:hypothetical protein
VGQRQFRDGVYRFQGHNVPLKIHNCEQSGVGREKLKFSNIIEASALLHASW